MSHDERGGSKIVWIHQGTCLFVHVITFNLWHEFKTPTTLGCPSTKIKKAN